MLLEPAGSTAKQLSSKLTSLAMSLLLLHLPCSAIKFCSGGQVTVGAIVSVTSTVKVQLALLPSESSAVAVTVVVPTGRIAPPGDETSGVVVTVMLPQSDTEGEAEMVALQAVGEDVTAFTGWGQIITGGTVGSHARVR